MSNNGKASKSGSSRNATARRNKFKPKQNQPFFVHGPSEAESEPVRDDGIEIPFHLPKDSDHRARWSNMFDDVSANEAPAARAEPAKNGANERSQNKERDQKTGKPGNGKALPSFMLQSSNPPKMARAPKPTNSGPTQGDKPNGSASKQGKAGTTRSVPPPPADPQPKKNEANSPTDQPIVRAPKNGSSFKASRPPAYSEPHFFSGPSNVALLESQGVNFPSVLTKAWLEDVTEQERKLLLEYDHARSRGVEAPISPASLAAGWELASEFRIDKLSHWRTLRHLDSKGLGVLVTASDLHLVAAHDPTPVNLATELIPASGNLQLPIITTRRRALPGELQIDVTNATFFGPFSVLIFGNFSSNATSIKVSGQAAARNCVISSSKVDRDSVDSWFNEGKTTPYKGDSQRQCTRVSCDEVSQETTIWSGAPLDIVFLSSSDVMLVGTDHELRVVQEFVTSHGRCAPYGPSLRTLAEPGISVGNGSALSVIFHLASQNVQSTSHGSRAYLERVLDTLDLQRVTSNPLKWLHAHKDAIAYQPSSHFEATVGSLEPDHLQPHDYIKLFKNRVSPSRASEVVLYASYQPTRGLNKKIRTHDIAGKHCSSFASIKEDGELISIHVENDTVFWASRNKKASGDVEDEHFQADAQNVLKLSELLSVQRTRIDALSLAAFSDKFSECDTGAVDVTKAMLEAFDLSTRQVGDLRRRGLHTLTRIILSLSHAGVVSFLTQLRLPTLSLEFETFGHDTVQVRPVPAHLVAISCAGRVLEITTHASDVRRAAMSLGARTPFVSPEFDASSQQAYDAIQSVVAQSGGADIDGVKARLAELGPFEEGFISLLTAGADTPIGTLGKLKNPYSVALADVITVLRASTRKGRSLITASNTSGSRDTLYSPNRMREFALNAFYTWASKPQSVAYNSDVGWGLIFYCHMLKLTTSQDFLPFLRTYKAFSLFDDGNTKSAAALVGFSRVFFVYASLSSGRCDVHPPSNARMVKHDRIIEACDKVLTSYWAHMQQSTHMRDHPNATIAVPGPEAVSTGEDVTDTAFLSALEPRFVNKVTRKTSFAQSFGDQLYKNGTSYGGAGLAQSIGLPSAPSAPFTLHGSAAELQNAASFLAEVVSSGKKTGYRFIQTLEHMGTEYYTFLFPPGHTHFKSYQDVNRHRGTRRSMRCSAEDFFHSKQSRAVLWVIPALGEGSVTERLTAGLIECALHRFDSVGLLEYAFLTCARTLRDAGDHIYAILHWTGSLAQPHLQILLSKTAITGYELALEFDGGDSLSTRPTLRCSSPLYYSPDSGFMCAIPNHAMELCPQDHALMGLVVLQVLSNLGLPIDESPHRFDELCSLLKIEDVAVTLHLASRGWTTTTHLTCIMHPLRPQSQVLPLCPYTPLHPVRRLADGGFLVTPVRFAEPASSGSGNEFARSLNVRRSSVVNSWVEAINNPGTRTNISRSISSRISCPARLLRDLNLLADSHHMPLQYRYFGTVDSVPSVSRGGSAYVIFGMKSEAMRLLKLSKHCVVNAKALLALAPDVSSLNYKVHWPFVESRHAYVIVIDPRSPYAARMAVDSLTFLCNQWQIADICTRVPGPQGTRLSIAGACAYLRGSKRAKLHGVTVCLPPPEWSVNVARSLDPFSPTPPPYETFLRLPFQGNPSAAAKLLNSRNGQIRVQNGQSSSFLKCGRQPATTTLSALFGQRGADSTKSFYAIAGEGLSQVRAGSPTTIPAARQPYDLTVEGLPVYLPLECEISGLLLDIYKLGNCYAQETSVFAHRDDPYLHHFFGQSVSFGAGNTASPTFLLVANTSALPHMKRRSQPSTFLLCHAFAPHQESLAALTRGRQEVIFSNVDSLCSLHNTQWTDIHLSPKEARALANPDIALPSPSYCCSKVSLWAATRRPSNSINSINSGLSPNLEPIRPLHGSWGATLVTGLRTAIDLSSPSVFQFDSPGIIRIANRSFQLEEPGMVRFSTVGPAGPGNVVLSTDTKDTFLTFVSANMMEAGSDPAMYSSRLIRSYPLSYESAIEYEPSSVSDDYECSDDDVEMISVEPPTFVPLSGLQNGSDPAEFEYQPCRSHATTPSNITEDSSSSVFSSTPSTPISFPASSSSEPTTPPSFELPPAASPVALNDRKHALFELLPDLSHLPEEMYYDVMLFVPHPAADLPESPVLVRQLRVLTGSKSLAFAPQADHDEEDALLFLSTHKSFVPVRRALRDFVNMTTDSNGYMNADSQLVALNLLRTNGWKFLAQIIEYNAYMYSKRQRGGYYLTGRSLNANFLALVGPDLLSSERVDEAMKLAHIITYRAIEIAQDKTLADQSWEAERIRVVERIGLPNQGQFLSALLLRAVTTDPLFSQLRERTYDGASHDVFISS